MVKNLQIIKDYWLFILVAINSIGYCYNYTFFKSFGIDIFKYITGSDLLFFSIELLIFVVVFLLLYEFIGVIISNIIFDIFVKKKTRSILYTKRIFEKNRNLIAEEISNIVSRYKTNLVREYLIYISFFINLIVSALILLNIDANIYFSALTASLVYIWLKSFKNLQKKYALKGGNVIIPIFSSILFISFFLVIMALGNATLVMYGSDEGDKTTFKYSNHQYETSKNLRFIGETGTYIFLYNKSEKNTLIVLKSKVENLKIQHHDNILYLGKGKIK